MNFQHNTGTADKSAWDQYCDCIDQLMATGRYASRHDAGLAVRKARPDLRNVQPPGVGPDGRVSSGASFMSSRPASGGAATGYRSAEEELDALAREYQSQHPGTTFAESYVRVLNARADLYQKYLEEQLEKLRAKAKQA